MRKFVYSLMMLFVFVSCNNKERQVEKINTNVEKIAVDSVLTLWHKSAAEAKFEPYFNAMTDKSVFIGTDAGENWNIKDFKSFSKPYFDKGKAWSFKAVERNIYVYNDGELAWFDELLDTWMGVCRGSGVLIKVYDGWKIEHYVLSLTIPNDNIEDVKNVNKEKDSLFLSKFKK